jgi:hypothetical protein
MVEQSAFNAPVVLLTITSTDTSGVRKEAFRGERVSKLGNGRLVRLKLMPNLLARFAGLFLTTFLIRANLQADSVPVRHPQGSAHGFVVLKTLDGTRIATGDMAQVLHGDRVTSSLTLRFRDGSIDEDTTVFSQRGVFRLISDHHIQRGPSFPRPIDILINAITGQITSRDKDGKATQNHLDLPSDVSNGLPPNLLMNILPTLPETKLAFVAPTAKPRLIHISIKPVGEAPFMIGGTKRKAIDYLLHVELGGITGAIAPLIGKQPGDYHIWILGGISPAFIREEGALYEGGPVWRIEQTSPTFPASLQAGGEQKGLSR